MEVVNANTVAEFLVQWKEPNFMVKIFKQIFFSAGIQRVAKNDG